MRLRNRRNSLRDRCGLVRTDPLNQPLIIRHLIRVQPPAHLPRLHALPRVRLECLQGLLGAPAEPCRVSLFAQHSRPHVSDDNPYSESQFKTLKYRPDFPERFGSLEDARAHCQHFFHWYNNDHRHSGIGLMTPHAVHYGAAEALQVQRGQVLQQAYEANPLRFKGCIPQPPALPTAVWINPSKENTSPSNTDPSTVITVNRVSQSD